MYSIRIQLFCLMLSVSGMLFSNEPDTTKVQTQQNLQDNLYIKDDGSISYETASDSLGSVAKKEVLTPIVFFSKERKSEVSKESIESVDNNVESIKKEEIKSEHSIVSSSLENVEVAKDISTEDSTKLLPVQTLTEEKLADSYEEIEIVDVYEADSDLDEYIPSYKRKSAYKNLEEATLASDRLLSQLKRKQGQKEESPSNPNSLSSRVVKGGNYVRSTAKGGVNSQSKKDGNSDFDYETDFGNEPTYYINGERVEKSEVLKLRKRNILSRTMKLKDTASRNPNGEIWIEVRE